MESERILLVVPCYNDVARLSEFLPELARGLTAKFRVLVSDDGSEVKEREALQSLVDGVREKGTAGCTVEVVFTERNTGKGGALMRGWAKLGDEAWVGFVDADGAVGLSEILRAEAWLGEQSGIDALFGSRVKILGRRVERSWKRHLSGRIFATLVSELGRVPVYDSQCGLKLVRAASYRRVAPFLQTEGFAFDVELLLLLMKLGCRVVEFPVDWRDVPGSKVSLLRDSWRMAGEVVRIQKRLAGLDLDSSKMV